MISKRILLGCLIFQSAFSFAQKPMQKVVANNFKELQQYFTYKDSKPVIISGHRGGMLPYFPENSIEAMEKTLTILPSFFEIDPRLTKDSVLVLMHDATLDRTTTLKGKVSDYTYEELKQARLKDRQGNITDFKIPTLMEALEWGKDKTIFNLDNKGIPWSKYVDMLKDKKYANILLSVRSMEEASYYYTHLKEVMLCVAIRNQSDLDAWKKTRIPYNRLVAYVGYTMDPKHQAVYDFLRSKGVMIFISIHPTQDKLKTDLEKVKGYSEELIKRPDIIETDYPALFVNEKP
ncbi:glycerophosphodiester phosphodiesterase family protein [Pseudobacter ginsenosidimutans]|uniref:Glycerophosphoryl diester phosphodiesterase n=1 Tax=Pseudobacter ginsenosidimutans TaxID=661488 RepID=A0A4Q7M8L1_9BACT|nr:glycerophosphodiester phosphodiesterase family protein [Pseudobacter ginsenosidimutans]QEC42570.1 glycerophosphodiester phosphodiesterase family protein [Pseudobacter ginsenosidimutans]RZS63941.1 glycerophosphoryl diester phosphodiesterase [Pseudobacter ginsenosidimutans]